MLRQTRPRSFSSGLYTSLTPRARSLGWSGLYTYSGAEPRGVFSSRTSSTVDNRDCRSVERREKILNFGVCFMVDGGVCGVAPRACVCFYLRDNRVEMRCAVVHGTALLKSTLS